MHVLETHALAHQPGHSMKVDCKQKEPSTLGAEQYHGAGGVLIHTPAQLLDGQGLTLQSHRESYKDIQQHHPSIHDTLSGDTTSSERTMKKQRKASSPDTDPFRTKNPTPPLHQCTSP